LSGSPARYGSPARTGPDQFIDRITVTQQSQPAGRPSSATASTNTALFEAARAVIPGGVDSPVRAFGSVGGTPRFIASASGAHVTDAEGRSYVDLVGSWGPALLGHAHPEVVAAVQAAAARGLSFGAPTATETLLAEEVHRRVPAAQKVRFVSTGTEATMTAVRLARGATGRDLVVKFAGCYHGHSDGLLAAAGSGLATGGLPGSAGVPTTPGFNAAIRRITAEHGALMILDEVLTGFRVGPAGWWGLEAVDGWTADLPGLATEPADVAAPSWPGADWPEHAAWVPDLVTFGKVVGGGMPLAAVGGRTEVMDLLAPDGPVYQAGTLSGNPLATAAGLATLQLADDAVYASVAARAQTIGEVVSAALNEQGVPHRVQRAGSLFSFMFGQRAAEQGVSDYEAARAQETWRYGPFFHAFLEAGVGLPPSVFEAWFVSAAHGEAELEAIAAAAPAAARAAARAQAN